MTEQIDTEIKNQLYREYIQPANCNIFEIINDKLKFLVPNWNKGKILDFGCNVGHLLETSNGEISEFDYTGVDVLIEPLEIAKKKYLNATWVHYNNYNSTFNYNGIKNLKLELTDKYDVIVAYDVFTHCEIPEIKKKIEMLKQFVNSNGIILFNLWEIKYFWRYLTSLKNNFNLDLDYLRWQGSYARDSVYLVNRKTIVTDKEHSSLDNFDWLETFFSTNYIQKQIPDVINLGDVNDDYNMIYAIIVQ